MSQGASDSASSALLGNVWSLSPSTPWLLSYSDLVMIVRHGRAWQPTPVPSLGETPRTEEPGGLQSMGSLRVGHNRAAKHIRHVLWAICLNLEHSNNTLRTKIQMHNLINMGQQDATVKPGLFPKCHAGAWWLMCVSTLGEPESH